jgi:hypothetical protein
MSRGRARSSLAFTVRGREHRHVSVVGSHLLRIHEDDLAAPAALDVLQHEPGAHGHDVGRSGGTTTALRSAVASSSSASSVGPSSDVRGVEALREKGRAAGARAPAGKARDGRGARRQEDARHEHDGNALRSGAHAVNPDASRSQAARGGGRGPELGASVRRTVTALATGLEVTPSICHDPCVFLSRSTFTPRDGSSDRSEAAPRDFPLPSRAGEEKGPTREGGELLARVHGTRPGRGHSDFRNSVSACFSPSVRSRAKWAS